MHPSHRDAGDRPGIAERRPPRGGVTRSTRVARRRRRPTLLLGALVIGGLFAGTVHDPTPAAARPTSVLAAQEALDTADGATELLPQASITEAEAKARLNEVTASRAARAEAEAVAREAARPKSVFPINGARLTSAYGPRWGTTHQGLDLAAPMLTKEYAAVDGVVLRAGPASGFGLAVYILTGSGDVMVYGHMEKIVVKAGQYVQAGQTVALVGSRGQSTGPHLHFEVQRGGVNGPRTDPMAWLRQRGVDVDAAL